MRGIPPRRSAWSDGRARNPFQCQRQTTPRIFGPDLSQPMITDSVRTSMSPQLGFGIMDQNNLLGPSSNVSPPTSVVPPTTSTLSCTNCLSFGADQFVGYSFSGGGTTGSTTLFVSLATSMVSEQC